MAGRNTSSRVQADHCRELALWTSDERTQHILLEMARELETEEVGEPADPAESVPRVVPPSLS